LEGGAGLKEGAAADDEMFDVSEHRQVQLAMSERQLSTSSWKWLQAYLFLTVAKLLG